MTDTQPSTRDPLSQRARRILLAQLRRVPLAHRLAKEVDSTVDLLELDVALEKLAAQEPQKVRVVGARTPRRGSPCNPWRNAESRAAIFLAAGLARPLEIQVPS